MQQRRRAVGIAAAATLVAGLALEVPSAAIAWDGDGDRRGYDSRHDAVDFRASANGDRDRADSRSDKSKSDRSDKNDKSKNDKSKNDKDKNDKDKKDKDKGNGRLQSVQILSFNDYHGHIESPDDSDADLGGGEYLSAKIKELREDAPKGRSLTVAAGDLIGGSPFLSGLFHDEPSVETLNEGGIGLDVSSVGNHEFDEGTAELLRMQHGGCHPVDGCYFPDDPYEGADFEWLAANVELNDGSGTLLPGTTVKKVSGMKIGFIGMTLEATPTLVSPAGVADVTFTDEVETANAEAAKLEAMGVEAIVVLLHEGGFNSGDYSECVGVSDPIATIATEMDSAIDMVVTGHTHQPYICTFDDPAGDPRLVTSAASYGEIVTETTLVIDRRTGDVDRSATTAENHLVTGVVADPAITEIVDKWDALSAPLAARVVGTIAEDITGDSNGDRGVETPMGDLVADAILWGTDGADEGGAEVAFMNIGGVRDSLIVDEITNGEGPGEVTYAEAYAVNPFGNLLVSFDLTGADLKAALEQQYDPTRSRQYLALAVSEGFTYTWDDSQPQGSKVVAGSIMLNGAPIEMGATYRVAMYNFLAEGGDSFTAFTNGTNLLGGPEDLANFVDYLENNPGLTAPADRIDGL